MKIMKNHLSHIAKLEWEGLQQKCEISPRINSENLLPSIIRKIEIFRDEDYEIKAKIDGRISDLVELREWLTKWNQPDSIGFVSALSFDFSQEPQIYKINGCNYEKHEHSNVFIDYGNENNFVVHNLDFEVQFNVRKVFKGYPKFLVKEGAGWLTEWYINGFRDFPFNRCTQRRITEYRRNRENLEEFTFEFDSMILPDFDHIFVQAEDISFVVHAVSKEFTPNWSLGIGIEYRGEWGGIPKPTEREAIAEIVSFIGGRQLFNVGYTRYNRIGYPVEEVYLSPSYPLKNDLVSSCQLPDEPPIQFHKQNKIEESEIVLQQLISKYLTSRDKLELHKALRSYWLFKRLPIGRNIPTLAAGIETLAKAWFAANNLKTEGKYLSGKRFKKLLGPELLSISKKLEEVENGDKVRESIEKAYEFYYGPSKVLTTFLDGINLSRSELEEKAMRQGRNKMAHSTLDFSNEAVMREMYILTKVYETLFNRIFLKILGFEGMYIDYSTFGLPEKHINEPTGG